MEAQEIIDAFRRQVAQLEAKGMTQVQVVALAAYLDALQKDAANSNEHRKREHEGLLAQYAAANEQSIEMFRAVLETGKTGLQTLLVINGGAVIALMGVMSNLATRSGGDLLARYLALPLLQFGIGVLCGAVGFAFRYFSQACYAAADEGEKNRYTTWGDWLRYTAIAVGISGYVLFGFALVNAYHGVLWSFTR
ncbi:hypothetical protein HNQ60_004927 [Povalibacter uvarum]|uniref:Uncharacterized protein n=1 Tax=Povalibacter uvarum TaxID=732238 RepID=A0A841HT31_9GAMM|nr:hypothetical protein [Povalibacter uvarum]MBB6096036.1 hypothetical protein [Povalibacter uvarum]